MNDEEFKDFIVNVKETKNRVLSSINLIERIDTRWKSIAITHFEQGCMALVKAISIGENRDNV